MASLEAETFLWRRIFKMSGSISTYRVLEAGSELVLTSSRLNEPFYATIFVKRLSAFTRRKPGNASTPTKTYSSVALLDSDCQSETIDYTDEGFICQVRVRGAEIPTIISLIRTVAGAGHWLIDGN